MATITEVAKRAGVSPTTASYALNGKACVKEETRQRILEAAKELHYVPNRLAQSFRNGKTNTITVITNEAIESANTFTNEFFGILAEARVNRYDVMVKLVDDTKLSFDQVKSVFHDRTSDGFLLLGNLPEQYLETLSKSGACGVLLSSHTETSVVQVNCNGYKGIYDITNLAFDSGKSSPVYFTYSDITTEEKLRIKGFRDAVDGRIEEREKSIFICGTDIHKIEEYVEQALQEGADCFVCWNDVLAYTIIDILKHKKMQVPKQVGVTGFDDILPTARKKILTTVHQPFLEKGHLAMKVLLAQIRGEENIQKEYLIDCNIVKGKSL